MADPIQRLSFELTEEQLLIRDAARAFAESRLAPGARQRDHEQTFAVDLLPELAEMGLLAMLVSPEDGGPGTDHVGYVLALTTLAEACASSAAAVHASNLATRLLSRHASPEQKERWLSPASEGRLGLLGMALWELAATTDPGHVETVARRDGAGWVLDGEKAWVVGGEHAGLLLVFAKTAPEAGSHGLSVFVVEGGADGLQVAPSRGGLGLRAAGTAAIRLEGCRVPDDHLVGDENTGYRMASGALPLDRLGSAAQSVGIAELAMHEGVAYAHERRAFGKRITDFGNTRAGLAERRADLDAAWLLTLRAARLMDGGDLARSETSIAKLFAAGAAGRVVDQMLQLHGGYGYSRDYAVERLYRDARAAGALGGAPETMRRAVAAEILRELEA